MSILTEEELCSILKVNRMFLWKCRSKGMPYIPLGSRLIRYYFPEVLIWLKENGKDFA